ncbi:hypothetical protein BSL78_27498 [Apostichopus japonicus]|uniref:Uncharacterized protein n=1 Tax=Stichopus japonicus TaxID=307972 RepID=A0A2G8JIV8_STIJA|nr:hypothetical protein BSL78_27498 [Apostichopus japonicus]
MVLSCVLCCQSADWWVNAAVVAVAPIGAFFFVVIVVASIILVFVYMKKNKHKPKSTNQVKYSSVEEKDMEAEKKESGDDGKPKPAPRSIPSSDVEKLDEEDSKKPLNEGNTTNDWIV